MQVLQSGLEFASNSPTEVQCMIHASKPTQFSELAACKKILVDQHNEKEKNKFYIYTIVYKLEIGILLTSPKRVTPKK
jgi:hypothetical protein